MEPKRPLKCKDIPDEPIMHLLAKRPGEWHNWFFGDDKDVRQAMPSGLPDKLVIGKMRMLMRRGLVTGCGCGCRGDFEITAKGIQWLAQVDSKLSIHPTQNRWAGVPADQKKEEL